MVVSSVHGTPATPALWSSTDFASGSAVSNSPSRGAIAKLVHLREHR